MPAEDPTTWEAHPVADAEVEAEPASPAPASPEPRRTALRDPGALLVGLWFLVAGVGAAIAGDAALDDVPPVLIPISFAVVGLGLLLPKRSAR